MSIISIEDYVCNLIAGRDIISNLYFATDKAREIRNRAGQFCYKVNIPGVGSNIYKGFELVVLDDKANCTPLPFLLADINGTPTLDQYILILLKARTSFLNLFQARYRAQFIREQAKLYCYTFNNVLGTVANVDKNSITFRNSVNFLDFFCRCENNIFDPSLVFSVN